MEGMASIQAPFLYLIAFPLAWESATLIFIYGKKLDASEIVASPSTDSI